eukprot:IDg17470t1
MVNADILTRCGTRRHGRRECRLMRRGVARWCLMHRRCIRRGAHCGAAQDGRANACSAAAASGNSAQWRAVSTRGHVCTALMRSGWRGVLLRARVFPYLSSSEIGRDRVWRDQRVLCIRCLRATLRENAALPSHALQLNFRSLNLRLPAQTLCLHALSFLALSWL